MVKYNYERGGKKFSQKSHYNSDNTSKTYCDNTVDKTNTLQKTGLKRETIDKFYTAHFIVKKCIDLVKKYIYIQKDDVCIEPSAGNGSFMNGIKTLFKNYKFYDLKPENDEIIEQNYLEFNYNTIIKKPTSKIHIIGNPPFGRQSSLAIKFIKKSCEYCDSISFILPRSFKKNSLKNITR